MIAACCGVLGWAPFDWLPYLILPIPVVFLGLPKVIQLVRFVATPSASGPAKAMARGDAVDAEREFAKALDRARRLSLSNPRRGWMLLELADYSARQGRFAEAKALFEEAAELGASLKHKQPALYLSALNNLASCLIGIRGYAAAQRTLEQLLDLTLLVKKSTGPAAAQFIELILHLNLVVLFIGMEELDEAEKHGKEAYAIFTALPDEDQAGVGDFFHVTCARLMLTQGNLAVAASEVDKLRNRQLWVSSPIRAKVLLAQRNYSEAEAVLRMHATLQRKQGPLHHPHMVDPMLDLGEGLFHQGKRDEAFAALEETRTIVADFALAPGPAWQRALSTWLDRARHLGMASVAASLEADLHKMPPKLEQGITILARLRAATT
jgi:tetratricopeptide (TPR) repeat protein